MFPGVEAGVNRERMEAISSETGGAGHGPLRVRARRVHHGAAETNHGENRMKLIHLAVACALALPAAAAAQNTQPPIIDLPRSSQAPRGIVAVAIGEEIGIIVAARTLCPALQTNPAAEVMIQRLRQRLVETAPDQRWQDAAVGAAIAIFGRYDIIDGRTACTELRARLADMALREIGRP
jgi:hypothetical protein